MKSKENNQIFLNTLTSLINNLFIKNKNYDKQFWMPDYTKYELLKDTKERARFILEKIEDIKHLID